MAAASLGRPAPYPNSGMTQLTPILLLLLSGLIGGPTLLVVSKAEAVDVEAMDTRLRQHGPQMMLAETLLTGTITERYPDGSLKSVTTYLNGRKEGESRGFYPDGSLSFDRTYQSGLKEGIHSGWWEDGTPKFEYAFDSGEHQGSAREWFRDGSLYREFNYQAGHESGSQKMWFQDGSLRANYVVRDGRRYGLIGTKPCS
ncbi:MAG: hypothetical protein ACI9W4_002716 [Rhodothermales bacterium]|jgi:hypothetical protein